MALPTSPSVVVLENDNSIYAPNVDSSVVGLVGFADKGPVNLPILITSQNNLLETFGRPDSNIPGQALEGALEILEATNQLYFVRAVNTETALNASAQIPIGFCPSVFVSSNGTIPASINLSYRLVNNLGVVVSNKILTLTSSVDTTTIEDLLENYFSPDLVGDAELIYGYADSKPFLASRYAGASATLSISSTTSQISFVAVDSDGGSAGAGASSVAAYGGVAEATGASSLYIQTESIYPGRGYNLSSLRDGTIVGVSIEVDSKSIRDQVSVNSNGTQRETFMVELSPSSPASIEYLLNTSLNLNESNIVNAQVLSDGSAFTIPDAFAERISSDKSFTSNGTLTYSSPRFVKMIEGTFSLAGGHSGYSTTETGSSDDFTALIGSNTTKTGIYALDDDSLNISLAAVPGITAQSVQNALISLAETSKNFLALVSPPYGLATVQEATDWMNGKDTRTAAINSSYVAAYWPWVQVFNYYAGADEWYDPAIFAARQCVYTDNVSEPWFAPAGYRRGRLLKPSNTELSLNQGDRDSLYSNNINPIVKENQAGIMIFGQRTGQRIPSALNSVNVRRMMIVLRKILLILGRPFQFEPNDEFTWELVEESVKPLLDDLIARRAIVDGSVRCDSTTNTPIRVDRKELWCSITIQPTLAAETIVFEVNLTNQSATING